MIKLRAYQQRQRLTLVSDDYQNRIGWGGRYKLNRDGEGGMLDPDYVDPEMVEKKDEGVDGGDDDDEGAGGG